MVLFQDYQKSRNLMALHFESVTIYFSDIVGFMHIVDESVPTEVHKSAFAQLAQPSPQMAYFLNSLYTMFDSVTDKYNIFKVTPLPPPACRWTR